MKSNDHIMSNLNKNFGKLLSSLCIIFASIFILYEEIQLALIFIVIAFVFLFISLRFPKFFSIPLRMWMKFGFLLGKFFNPIILGFLFFTLITPLGILTRLFGRDELLLKKNNKKSYWLARSKSYGNSVFFERQF